MEAINATIQIKYNTLPDENKSIKNGSNTSTNPANLFKQVWCIANLLNFTNPIRIELILIIKITAINNKIPQSLFKTGHKTKRNAKKNITSAIESNLEPKTVSFSQILAIYPSRISLRPHKIKIIKNETDNGFENKSKKDRKILETEI